MRPSVLGNSRDEMALRFKVHMKIQKPVAEVFDAVYDPKKLSGYFTSGGASAPLREGTTVEWTFADSPESTYPPFPVLVKRVEPNRRIVLEWAASDGAYNTRVEMTFEPLGRSDTLVSISESGWRPTPAGQRSSYGNCGGWMQMLCCLKGYVQYGINLRKGSY